MKIFLVEDSSLLRGRLEAILSAIPGMQTVGHASGAKDAVQAILATRPDAVVLDLRLDESNGLDVLQAIKKVAPHCFVIVLTSYHQLEFRELCLRYGANHFFHKASEFERVAEVLSLLASQADRPAGPPSSPGTSTL